MKKIRNILFLSILICATACKDEDTLCSLPRNVNFIANFYRIAGGAEQTAVAPSLSIYLLNGTNPIYNHVDNAATFSLPLNATTDSAKFVLMVSNTAQSDTLTVVYTTQNSVLSAECGNISVNNISKVTCTNHSIQSYNLVKATVNNDGLQNVKLFLY